MAESEKKEEILEMMDKYKALKDEIKVIKNDKEVLEDELNKYKAMRSITRSI